MSWMERLGLGVFLRSRCEIVVDRPLLSAWNTVAAAEAVTSIFSRDAASAAICRSSVVSSASFR